MPPRSKPDLVYEALRKDILSGALRPRERIVATTVAKQLGVSEIPVREALKRLEAEALVKIVPNSGAFVADLTVEQIDELFQMRSVLEGLAARSAFPHLGLPDIELLDSLNIAMQDCVKTGAHKRFAELNREFHRTLYGASPYPYLKKTMFDLLHRTEWSVAIFSLIPSYDTAQVRDHMRMVDCIRLGDVTGLENTMREHVLEAARNLQSLVGQGILLVWPAAAGSVDQESAGR